MEVKILGTSLIRISGTKNRYYINITLDSDHILDLSSLIVNENTRYNSYYNDVIKLC